MDDKQNQKRFVISERRVRGAHKMALGDKSNICAFCNGRLTVLSADTFGCFNCSCKYFDYTDSIRELIEGDENITMSDISERLNIDIQYLSEYMQQKGIEIVKGESRICPTCGRVIPEGGECKNCALRSMSKFNNYNARIMSQTHKERTKPQNDHGMHYIGRKNPRGNHSLIEKVISS